jgi:hypothetical protein
MNFLVIVSVAVIVIQEVLPIARKLGERVLESCATRLKPYLEQAVDTLGISFDDYSDVLASACRDVSDDVAKNDVCVTSGHVYVYFIGLKKFLHELTYELICFWSRYMIANQQKSLWRSRHRCVCSSHVFLFSIWLFYFLFSSFWDTGTCLFFLIRWIARLQKKPHHHNKIMLLGTDLLSLS